MYEVLLDELCDDEKLRSEGENFAGIYTQYLEYLACHLLLWLLNELRSRC